MNLCQVSVIKSLMAEAGITFRKEYGQNFLISPDVPERIADECADSADTVVLEIGPVICSSPQSKQKARLLITRSLARFL